MEADHSSKPSKRGGKWSESGKPLSQDSDELILNDGKEEVVLSDNEGATKRPVVLSDNEDGPPQAITVAINTKGVQKFPNV